MPLPIASTPRARIDLDALTNRAFQYTGASVHQDLHTDLADLKATITMAAIDKGCNELGPHTRDAIDILINMATGNGTMGTEAQKVLRDIYADPKHADIRADLHQAALSMCEFAHRAPAPSGGALSVTVAYLGAFALGPNRAGGDVGNFLNNYLNRRVGAATNTPLISTSHTVSLSQYIDLGQTQEHVRVCKDAISLDMHAADIGDQIGKVALSAMTGGKPEALWVTDTLGDSSKSIILVVDPEPPSNYDLHLINTAAGTPDGDRMQKTLEAIAQSNGVKLDIHASRINFSAYQNYRILQSLNTRAGELVNPAQLDWMGTAIDEELDKLSTTNAPNLMAKTVSGQAEILDHTAREKDGFSGQTPDDILKDAKGDHPAPMARASHPLGRGDNGSVNRTQHGPVTSGAHGHRSQSGPMPLAAGHVAIPSFVAPAMSQTQIAAIERLTNLGEVLGIEKGPSVGGFASHFSKRPQQASAFYSARDTFATTLSTHQFDKLRESGTSNRRITELISLPNDFLNACNDLAVAGRGASVDRSNAVQKALTDAADLFLMRHEKARSDIQADIEKLGRTANAKGPASAEAGKLRDALISLRDNCLDSDLNRRVNEFARQVRDCPAAVIDYLQPGPATPAIPMAVRMAIPIYMPVMNPGGATNNSIGLALNGLRHSGETLKIERDAKNGFKGLRSTFSDLAQAHVSLGKAPENGTPGVAFHAAVQRFKNSRDLFIVSSGLLPNALAQSRAIYKIMEKVANDKALANLAIKPRDFLANCNKHVVSINNASPQKFGSIKDLLQNEAREFIAQRALTLSKIDDAVAALFQIAKKPGDAADLQRRALIALRNDCLDGELHQGVIAFAEQVQISPDAAVFYFNDCLTVGA